MSKAGGGGGMAQEALHGEDAPAQGKSKALRWEYDGNEKTVKSCCIRMEGAMGTEGRNRERRKIQRGDKEESPV